MFQFSNVGSKEVFLGLMGALLITRVGLGNGKSSQTVSLHLHLQSVSSGVMEMKNLLLLSGLSNCVK